MPAVIIYDLIPFYVEVSTIIRCQEEAINSCLGNVDITGELSTKGLATFTHTFGDDRIRHVHHAICCCGQFAHSFIRAVEVLQLQTTLQTAYVHRREE